MNSSAFVSGCCFSFLFAVLRHQNSIFHHAPTLEKESINKYPSGELLSSDHNELVVGKSSGLRGGGRKQMGNINLEW